MNNESLKTVEIRWTLPDLEPAQGTGSIRVFSQGEISRRANSFFWKCVIGGFVAIILPPHILYPLIGIVAGIVGKKSIQKQRYSFIEGQVTCPSCNTIQVVPKANEEFPFLHFCSQCRARGEIDCKDFVSGEINFSHH